MKAIYVQNYHFPKILRTNSIDYENKIRNRKKAYR